VKTRIAIWCRRRIPKTGEAIDEGCADIRDAVSRAAELIRAGYLAVITSTTVAT
jgi:hypothetical protein